MQHCGSGSGWIRDFLARLDLDLDLDLTFLTKKSVYFGKLFFKMTCSYLITYRPTYVPRKVKLCSSPCQLFSQPCFKGRIRIRNYLKSRIRIQIK
jgi:hypothetical protein